MSTKPTGSVATMTTASSPWPHNIDTAETLLIREPCLVVDAYSLICDRPNIRTVAVHSYKYTSQEIRNMSFHEQLGERDHIQWTVRDTRGGEPAPVPPQTQAFEDWVAQGSGPVAPREVLGAFTNTLPDGLIDRAYQDYMRTYAQAQGLTTEAPTTTPQPGYLARMGRRILGIDPVADTYTRA